MLEISKTVEGSKLTIALVGRVDTTTAPSFEQEVKGISGDITDLVIDMEGLTYVSSAGLRVLLLGAKAMRERGGTFATTNVPDIIMETFEMTGLTDVMNVS